MQATLCLLGHFGVDHPAPRQHPLHTTIREQALITQMVFMTHTTVDHVGNGFKTAMRMRWKTTHVIRRFIAFNFIQQ